MALKEHFENSGQWLFRWRSYLPLIGLAVILAAFREYKYPMNSEKLDGLWEAFCLLISFSGLAVRLYTIGHTPKNTSGRNTKKQVADTLNTSGAYSLVRNPLYLGNFLMVLGIVLFVHLWWMTLIYTLAFWLYYERIIFAEETFLRNKFGETYLSWANRTPAIIPSFNHYKKPELPFSLRNVLRREYNGFFAVIACMFIFETFGEISINHELEFDWEWVVLVAIGFLTWLTLRSLKKYTELLNVEGR